jgi:ABC-2 type transport system permease protein
MNNKGLTKHLLMYEIRNAVGNIFVIIFGVVFPIVMAILFANVIAGQAPDFVQTDVRTTLFLTMLMAVPMAIMFIGYAATYSQDVENNVAMRLDLFGINKSSILVAKLIAYLIFLLATTALYIVVVMQFVEIHPPSIIALCLLIFIVVLLGALLLVIAHAIAEMAGKFSRAFAITMFLYFGFTILCGMMGLQVSQFPLPIQRVAKLLPMTYMSTGNDFLLVWKGESYDPTYFILSFAFLAVAAAVLIMICTWRKLRSK